MDTPPVSHSVLTWNVEADPPSEKLTAWPETVEPISLEVGSSDKFLFPSTSSHVMGLTGGYGKDRFCEVWDLTRMERVGRIESIEQSGEPHALSPDGRYYAARTQSSSTGGLTYVIGIWSVQSGDFLHAIEPTKTSSSILLTFAGPGRLVTVTDEYQKQNTQVWDVAHPRLLNTFQMTGDHRWDGSAAVSPGGRYLVKIDATMKVHDLTAGRLVGETRMAAGSKKWTCQAASYSPDGAELVTMLHGLTSSPVGSARYLFLRGARVRAFHAEWEP